MCVLLCLNPNWLSISGLQESSDSSNTTVEDEDVKGKTENMRHDQFQRSSKKLRTDVCCKLKGQNSYNNGKSLFHCIDVIIFRCSCNFSLQYKLFIICHWHNYCTWSSLIKIGQCCYKKKKIQITVKYSDNPIKTSVTTAVLLCMSFLFIGQQYHKPQGGNTV